MSSPNPLAVVNARQIVTLAGPARPRIGPEMRELAIVEDGAMIVRDGRIEAIGPSSEIEIPADAGIVNADGRIVLPGFVDAHTHPVFAGTRADEYEQRAQAPPMPKSPRAEAAFAQRCAARVKRAPQNCCNPPAATSSGSCAAGPPRSKPNPAMGYRSTLS